MGIKKDIWVYLSNNHQADPSCISLQDFPGILGLRQPLHMPRQARMATPQIGGRQAGCSFFRGEFPFHGSKAPGVGVFFWIFGMMLRLIGDVLVWIFGFGSLVWIFCEILLGMFLGFIFLATWRLGPWRWFEFRPNIERILTSVFLLVQEVVF